jgi:probable addiction module antidote protein
MTISTKPWDIQEYLKTNEDMIGYLEAAFEDGDPDLIGVAIGDIARARGISNLARETGLTREGLYKALKPGGNPRLKTLHDVLKALGLRLHVVAIGTKAA